MAGTASRASRRAFLGSALAALKLAAQSQKGAAFAPEWLRYEDPTTEMEVVRLTDPAYSSALPAHYNRAVAHSGASLICGSDRTGQPQAFRIDLRTGDARQLTEVAELDVASLALSPDSRSFCCFAGRSLLRVNLPAETGVGEGDLGDHRPAHDRADLQGESGQLGQNGVAVGVPAHEPGRRE